MKVCSECNQINPDSAGVCIGCGFTTFTPLILKTANDYEEKQDGKTDTSKKR